MMGTGARGGASPAVHSGRRPLIPRARPGSDGLPEMLPSAGHYLIAGIDSVLPRLTGTPDPLALADDLRVALARTAACGDTCRVRGAADAVRSTVALLLDGAFEEARAELVRTRMDLARRH
jgi:hypothetical protein